MFSRFKEQFNNFINAVATNNLKQIQDSKEHNNFIEVLASGDLKKIQDIVESGFDLNYQDEAGNTVLHAYLKEKKHHHVFGKDKEKVLEALLWLFKRDQLNINLPNAKGNTFLHLICADHGFIAGKYLNDLLKVILSRCDHIDITNHQGLTPIFAYFLCGIEGDSIKSPGDMHGKILALLLTKTTNIDFQDKKGRSLIHYLSRVRIYKEVVGIIQELWRPVLECKPNLNLIDHDGDHILDLLDAEQLPELYQSLINNGAQLLSLEQLQTINQNKQEITNLTDTTATIVKILEEKSPLLCPKSKIKLIRKFIESDEEFNCLISADEFTPLAKETWLKEFKENYSALKNRVKIALTPLDKDKLLKYEVESEEELSVLENKLKKKNYFFVNRGSFGKNKVRVYSCREIILTHLPSTPAISLRQLGWGLLPTQFSKVCQEQKESLIKFDNTSLRCHDLTASDVPLLIHKTNSNPKKLKKAIDTDFLFLNDMVYISATYRAPGINGFHILPHDDAPFNVYLILDVDPQSIFIFSKMNVSSPYSRGTFKDPILSMVSFLQKCLQDNILDNYFFNELQLQKIIPMESNTDYETVTTGTMQIKSETTEGSHNEIIFVGNQLAKRPSRVIGLAVDICELNTAEKTEQYNELIKVLNDSKLPIAILDLNKQPVPNNRKPFVARLERNTNITNEQRQALTSCLFKHERLKAVGQKNDAIEKEIEELKMVINVSEENHQGLEREANVFSML